MSTAARGHKDVDHRPLQEAHHGDVRQLRQRRRQGVHDHAGDQTKTFDSFECAINVMAPVCPVCSATIVGHGVEADGQIYCCAHCAERAGAGVLQDRA
jgi:hypothetical protein